jgi:hypothetical protein
MDPSAGIGFLSFAGLPAEPLLVSKTSIVVMDILSAQQ